MNDHSFVRFFIVTDNMYLYLGFKSLIEQIGVYNNKIWTISQTNKLPECSIYSKERSYDIIISDNYLHRYLASQNAVKNVIILPANFDVTTYVDCFNDLKSIKVDSLEKCLKQLSFREKLLFAFFSAGIDDDSIAAILQISKKTISAHRRNILAKLNLKNRNELYLYALAIKEGDQ